MDNRDLVRRFYPEANVGGFSHVDGTISFFAQIAAVLKPSDYVLDFGAGRGAPLHDDTVGYRRRISNLQGRCSRLEGCDIDGVVLENPFLDHAEVISLGAPLPYPNERFDIVISRAVFGHVEDPDWLAGELLRVVKPGGLVAAFTPNKFGYFAVAARIVPRSLHVKAPERIQPGRKSEDTLPTLYRVNTLAALQKAFGHQADVYVAYVAPEPAYHFGNPVVYRVVRWLNKHLPASLQPSLLVYIRKH